MTRMSSGESVDRSSDPVVQELDRLQNLLQDRDRELGNCLGEIESLKTAEVLKDKAVEELKLHVNKLKENLGIAEDLLEQRNLEVRKLAGEKRDAVVELYAAESTLRRVCTDQKDEELPPMESVIAPLEAEIKMQKNEIAALQEDKKALERLTKSKELALLEAERILRSALERALIVEEVQNHNYELKRQIEICLEENKILEKNYRQKVMEVEKLSQTIQELEEAILVSGATANAVRDYRRQISELNEEKRTLERELARAKVSANRVATVVANEWKDENDKVMPVRQWLEERRLLQAEMQRLRDKLAISERTAKAEAQLKDKLKLRLRTLEEGLRNTTITGENTSPISGTVKSQKPNGIFGFLTNNNGLKKRSTSQPRGSSIHGSPSRQPSPQVEELMIKRGRWVSRSKVADITGKEVSRSKVVDLPGKENAEAMANLDAGANKSNDNAMDGKDMVSGFLYDRLQKEVINLRKSSDVKDTVLTEKDQEIQMLVKKVDMLTKAVEVESRKTRREAAAREKEALPSNTDGDRKSISRSTTSRRVIKA
ncbi:hypothetical protein MLD38_021045 [Melastoma candidum]|uniref:Uncharacterized protein n=1 Tax=Melastoma candidum TaxID=119954 RepID=A0ACB9QEC1_9MYRT|nr:hypothetical protein MLD38_021045 [Melastoma candidum]